DPREAQALADRVVLLEDGRITHTAQPLLLSSEVKTTFGRLFAAGLSCGELTESGKHPTFSPCS
ncbi:MAG: hypothetical protein MUC50_15450, partial [Myxococcota bacterium]|nr:hypothetical protein [Myxococcota bacterium]